MPGTLLVRSSAIEVGSTRRLPDAAAQAGSWFVDAPVPGWTAGATEGTLTSVIGGVEADVEAAGQDTRPMAGVIIATGGLTTRQAPQICSDLLALFTTTGLARGVTRAGRPGLDHVRQDILTASSGDPWALDDRYPVPSGSENASSDNDVAATFAPDLALDDMLAVAADRAGTDQEAGRLSTSMYQRLSDAGAANLSCSAAVKVTDGSIDRRERN